MKFSSFVIEEIENEWSLTPLELTTPFIEKDIIEGNRDYIFADMGLETIEIVEKGADCSITTDTKQQREQTRPGKPIAYFC